MENSLHTEAAAASISAEFGHNRRTWLLLSRDWRPASGLRQRGPMCPQRVVSSSHLAFSVAEMGQSPITQYWLSSWIKKKKNWLNCGDTGMRRTHGVSWSLSSNQWRAEKNKVSSYLAVNRILWGAHGIHIRELQVAQTGARAPENCHLHAMTLWGALVCCGQQNVGYVLWGVN